MSPYLNPGDLVIIFRTKSVKKNDVVVFERDEDYYIKRVSKIDDDSTSPRLRGASRYFLEGDNKKDSLDSKKIGWIDKKDIIGKVIYKISKSQFLISK